jgi:hypothetical protein
VRANKIQNVEYGVLARFVNMKGLNFFLLVFLLFSPLLYAQEGAPFPGPFPLGPVLAEAVHGEGRWRPDWPLEIAPDAFMIKGEAAAIAMELDASWEIGGTGDSAPAGAPDRPAQGSRYRGISYRLAWDSGGRLIAFPLPLAGGEAPAFAQVEVRYGGGDGIEELRILVPPGEDSAGEGSMETDTEEPDSWSVLFPAPWIQDTLPAGAPVKIQRGAAVYFVLFSGSRDWIAETWYDPWGNFAAYFETRIGPGPGGEGRRVLGLEGLNYRQDYGYESGGNLSACSGDQGLFSVVYSAQGRPLYWMAGRDYGLQWDEEGRLTGMRDLAPQGSGEEPAAFRYEYEFDSRGNWVRRREIALFLRENLLLPGRMLETVRRIDYREGD